MEQGSTEEEKGETYFIPKHCLEPLLNGTTNLLKCPASDPSHRSGEKVCGSGKRFGLKCKRTEVMPTGVCIATYQMMVRKNGGEGNYAFGDDPLLCLLLRIAVDLRRGFKCKVNVGGDTLEAM